MQAFLHVVARDTSPTLSSKRAPTLSSKRARSSNYADRSIPSSRALSNSGYFGRPAKLQRRAREQFNALYALDDLLIRSRDGSRLFCTRRILSVQLDCISEEVMV